MNYFASLSRLLWATITCAALVGCQGQAGSGLATTPAFDVPHIIQSGGQRWLLFNQGLIQGQNLSYVAVGSDRNIWFTYGTGVGTINEFGSATTFPVSIGTPYALASGPKKSLWFTIEPSSGIFGSIGQATTTGQIQTFQVPFISQTMFGITGGPDGNIWFTSESSTSNSAQIGKMSPSGRFFTAYPLPNSASSVRGIAAGADGNLWFAEEMPSKIGRITPQGVITEFGPLSGYTQQVTKGPDGNIWFTESDPDFIGKITPAGVITEYSVPAANGETVWITVGPDKELWFTNTTGCGCQIGEVSTSGVFKEYYIPYSSGQPFGITSGPDGNLWMAYSQSVLVYARRLLTVTPSSITFTSIGQTQAITVKESHYHGTWTAASSDPSIASVAPGAQSNMFVVTANGSGSTNIVVSDSKENTFDAAVTVP